MRTTLDVDAARLRSHHPQGAGPHVRPRAAGGDDIHREIYVGLSRGGSRTACTQCRPTGGDEFDVPRLGGEYDPYELLADVSKSDGKTLAIEADHDADIDIGYAIGSQQRRLEGHTGLSEDADEERCRGQCVAAISPGDALLLTHQVPSRAPAHFAPER